MSNTPQNPNQKTQDDRYSNQSKQGTNPSQKDQDKNNDRNSTQQKDSKSADANKACGMKKDPQNSDTRREREEEDRPRAGTK